jgi:hypothetical protein
MSHKPTPRLLSPAKSSLRDNPTLRDASTNASVSGLGVIVETVSGPPVP